MWSCIWIRWFGWVEIRILIIISRNRHTHRLYIHMRSVIIFEHTSMNLTSTKVTNLKNSKLRCVVSNDNSSMIVRLTLSVPIWSCIFNIFEVRIPNLSESRYQVATLICRSQFSSHRSCDKKFKKCNTMTISISVITGSKWNIRDLDSDQIKTCVSSTYDKNRSLSCLFFFPKNNHE